MFCRNMLRGLFGEDLRIVLEMRLLWKWEVANSIHKIKRTLVFAGSLQVINEYNEYTGPSGFQIRAYSDEPGCYGVVYRGDSGREMGFNVLFGGPGGLKCRK